ncbi:MAG: hypothetical protein MUC56_06955 [Thermoanaerobaculales bacterium]|jgi:hypothetical protein|nr:hypothetical protein [Thermoanaerobaculales bacterium]
MRQRGMSTIGGALLAALAGVATAVAITDWMVIDVRVADPEPVHIKVPFPLFVADLATELVPDEVLAEAEIPPEVTASREMVLAAVSSLLDAPDTTLVKVEAPDARVEIAKTGDNLTVAVDADDAVVRCTVPLDGVLHALERWDWKSADPDLIFDALGKADNGPLVTVDADDGTKVAINLW